MELDRDRVRFKGKAIKLSLEFGGSISDEDGERFFEELYAEFRENPASAPEPWLRERLSKAFVSMTSPPSWVEAEPSWPFHEGKPMIFISQITLDDNAISNQLLSPGETVYLFGIRQLREHGPGYEMRYRVVSQFGDLNE